MAKPVVFVLHSLCISIVALPYIQSGCQYEGRAYKEGQDIRLEDPCVKCNCVRGSLVCRLRVCAPQPHPPPPGCWLLRRRNDCCHKLVCSREVESGRSGSHGQIPEGGVKDGCVVNGTVYGEGSAMDTSSHCQYCYCIKGQQHCVKPECLLTEPGCTPVYNSQSCCPAKYNCSAAVNNTSTTPPSVLEHGCLVNGKYYPEGDMVTSLRNNCENCYCMKNKVWCEPIVCSVPLNQKCTPVITNGHCCPTSYNCNPEEFENTNGIDKKKQEVYNVNATWNLPVLHINKYLSSAAYSERSITDSSILSTGNTTLSTISKLDTQNTLQTNKNTSSEISTKNTTISKPMTGNVTSKPSTENTLLKLSTGNTTILAKPSTGSINFSKQTTRNNTAISKPGTTNATVSKLITKNPTVLKQPSTKNTVSSKLSAENSTVSKQSAKNSTLSKPSTQNITKSKSSTENITVSKPSTKNSTVSKPNSENATKSKPSTENVMLSIPGSESTTVTKLSTENTNMSKSSTENTELLKPSTENTTELQVNSEVITKPNTHNTSKSEPSAGNTTVQKTTIESAVSKPNTENITLSKISAENTTKPKLPAENTTVSVTTITSANTVTEMSTQTEPVIQTEETASMTTTTESTITTTTQDLAETTIMVMTTTGTQSFNDTENRVASASADEEITTIKTEDYTTTMSHAETTLTLSTVSAMNQTSEVQKKTGISEPIRKIPSELEAILNNTRENDEDYEYDYNEPSLPPSLPNLRIIPFVAADAVVDDPDDSVYTPSQDKMLPTDSPHFYSVAHSNRFSPPIETEGGFVPKEPILDGPFYESKYDVPYHTTGLNSLPLDITSGTILPPITEPPKLLGNEQCLSGGHHYRHGELLTEPTACDLCLCFYGEILCQEPKCPPVKPSCHRIRERERGSCCGKIICGVSNSESPTRVVDHVTPLSQTLQNSVPHLPAFTVADVIVTPDPFRDVIRTEPAPDLPSLIGEIMPYLWEHTTMPTPIMHTRTTPRPPPISTTLVSLINTTHSKTTSAVNKISHGSINQLNDSTIKLVKHKNTSLNIDHKTELNILKKKDEVDKDNYDDNNDKDDGDENNDDDDDNDDSFSFDSVFHYLFNGEPLTKSPQVTTSRVDIKTQNITTIMSDVKNKTHKINDTEEIIEHRSEEDSNSVLDYINNTTSVPSFADKTTSLETYEKLEYVDDTKNANSIETTTNQSSAPVQTTQKYFVKSATTRKHYATKQTTSVKPSHFSPLSVPDPGAVSGLLKLAGCNIYGRMYRVGRIISELSGPCLECMCTEVGVQCRPLKC